MSGDVEVTLRIRAENLEALRVAPEDAAESTKLLMLVEVEPEVFRLGGSAAVKAPRPLHPIEVMREAGVADEVDELFLGGDAA